MIPKKSKSARVRAFSSLKELTSLEGVFPALPNDECPFVMRKVTRREIAGIPNDRYVVMELKMASGGHRISHGNSPEEKVHVTIGLAKQILEQMSSVRFDIRKLSRISGGNDEPPSNIFIPPIREDMMSDCIAGVVGDFFHEENSCTICNRSYNRMEFCVLMHFYFKYIGILSKDSRLQFSTFLQNTVFAGMSHFGERTYNTYATKDIFVSFWNELKQLKVDFTKHPKLPPDETESTLKPAFQEIGWAFRHSDYFCELRELRKNLQAFNI